MPRSSHAGRDQLTKFCCCRTGLSRAWHAQNEPLMNERALRARVLGACVAAFLVQVTMLASEPEEEIIYTRADVVAATTGEVEFRRAYTKRLALPQTECEGGVFTCVADRIYGQIYSLAFSEELISRQRDGKVAAERRLRGRLLVAVDLSPENEDLLEVALVAHFEGLSVKSYSRPQAGMRYLRGPLSQQTLLQSALPAWVCTELDGEYSFDLVISDEEGFDRSYARTGDVADRACRAIANAVDDVSAETLRTMPDIRTQVRHKVHLRSVSTFAGLTWSDDLASIPDGVVFEKRVLDGTKTGGMQDRRDGVYRGHEGRYGDVERDVLIPSAALYLMEAPMWVTRWSFSAVSENFGTQPEVVQDSAASIVMAVIPIADAVMAELSRTRTTLHVPGERLVDEAIARFTRSGVLAPSLVEAAFADPEIWPAQGDWMVVSCPDDGSARYGIAPFSAAAEVTNPREACAAITREIGE